MSDAPGLGARPPRPRLLLPPEPRSSVWMKRAIVAVLVFHAPLAMWSGYRAIVQVFALDLRVAGPVLRAGSTVGFRVVTSARTTVDVTLEVVQGERARTLATRRVPGNRNPAYDPRPRRDSLALGLPPETLAALAPGPAVIRATAVGRSQWLRLPPPTVREAAVTVAP